MHLKFLPAGAVFPVALDSKWPWGKSEGIQASTVNVSCTGGAAVWRLQPNPPRHRALQVGNTVVLLSLQYEYKLKSQGMSRPCHLGPDVHGECSQQALKCRGWAAADHPFQCAALHRRPIQLWICSPGSSLSAAVPSWSHLGHPTARRIWKLSSGPLSVLQPYQASP